MSRQGSRSVRLSVTDDVNRIEAPVTWKAYLMCAFASFGGIFFGYDSGYINGVNGSEIFIHKVEGPDATALSSSHQSLIVSILSAGTFFGALIAGDLADMIGRKWTVILGCLIYLVGVVIQMITGAGDALAAIVTGRLVAGIGVGFESAIVILYMSEIVRSFLSCSLFGSDLPNKQNSAHAKFEEPLSPAINSALPSVSCWHPLWSMPLKIAVTLGLTESQLRSSSPGLSSWLVD